ncbi:MAG TPA: hypothetical protein VE135_25605 [Pyrinomonadaceae bacterium]|nr:hypothetical protein [Pyrinomonadaceae bacterium]
MKKQIFNVLVTGCLLALMLAVPASAQEPGTAMRADIPFDFIVRGKTLPAGNYEIERINDSPEGLIIRNINDKHDHAMFETLSVETRITPSTGEIVFHRYGDSYFLAEVLTPGEQIGRELVPSRAERQLKRELASNKTEAETVALALY